MKVLILLLFLGGCASTITHQWKGTKEYNQDSYECEKDTAAIQDALYQRYVWDKCMAQKGWK